MLHSLLTQRLGRAQSDKVLHLVLDDHTLLLELMEAYFSRDTKVVNLAAMTMGNLARRQPALLQPYQGRIYEVSINPVHPGVRRNALRYFSELPVLLTDDAAIPKWIRKKDFIYLHEAQIETGKHGWLEEEREGPLLDHCLEMIKTVNEPTANRAFAMYAAKNLCIKYPEIAVELSGTIREYRKTGTVGFTHMAAKIGDLLDRLVEHYGL